MSVYDSVKQVFQDLIAPQVAAIEARLGKMEGCLDALGSRMESRFETLEAKIEGLRTELRAELRRVDERLDGVDQRLNGLERRIEESMNVHERLAALEAKISRN